MEIDSQNIKEEIDENDLNDDEKMIKTDVKTEIEAVLEKSCEESKFGDRLECEFCKKVFSRKRNLKYHLVTHLPPDERQKLLYDCPDCDKKYYRKYDLKVHRKVIHSFEEPPVVKNEIKSKDSNSLECDVCRKVFKNKRNLNHHLESHLPPEEREKLLFPCPQCDKKFVRKHKVKNHIKTFHLQEKKTLVCDECGKIFSSNSSLCEHKRVVHDNKKQQQCSLCPKVFANLYKLKKHINYSHHLESHKCLECGQILKNKKTLWSHMLTHNDLKPFKCDLCEKSFKWDKNLKSHRITHTGERPFICRYCPQSYANKSNCNKHEKHSHPEKFTVEGAKDEEQDVVLEALSDIFVPQIKMEIL